MQPQVLWPLETPQAGKAKKNCPLKSTVWKHPAYTLISYFCHPEWWENKFLFKDTQSVVIGYSSPRKLIQGDVSWQFLSLKLEKGWLREASWHIHTCTVDHLLESTVFSKYCLCKLHSLMAEGLTSRQVHVEAALMQLCDKLFEAWVDNGLG